MQGPLPKKLRVLRAETGWSLREAASIIGVTPNTLSDLERGRRHPSDKTLSKIAKGYGADLDELVNDFDVLDTAELLALQEEYSQMVEEIQKALIRKGFHETEGSRRRRLRREMMQGESAPRESEAG